MESKLTPDQKIENIAQQIRACGLGALQELGCPYCGASNKQGQPLCCNLFAAAALAILQREDLREKSELAERIGEKALVQ
jgi:hypothetical protein